VQGTLLVAVKTCGGRIPGAGTESWKRRRFAEANTDERGEARVESLPPGTYTIAVHARGFGDKEVGALRLVSSQATFAVILGAEALKETIQVRDLGISGQTGRWRRPAARSARELRPKTW